MNKTRVLPPQNIKQNPYNRNSGKAVMLKEPRVAVFDKILTYQHLRA